MIIPSENITSRAVSLVEFPDEYLINGVFYKKDTMENTGKFLFIPSVSTYPEVIVDRYVNVRALQAYARDQMNSSMFYDSNNNNILWLIHNNLPTYNSGENLNYGIRKFEKIDGAWKHISHGIWQNTTTSDYRYFINPIKQDNNFIYLTVDVLLSNLPSYPE